MGITTDTREVAVTKYFTRTPKPPSDLSKLAFILGGLLALAGLIIGIIDLVSYDSTTGFACCMGPAVFGGAVIAGIGGAGASKAKSKYKKEYEAAEPKPSEAQLDEWLNQDKERIISDAMSKLGLVPEKVLNSNEPLVVVGPRSSAKFKMGQDGNIRFSAYKIVVIYLTDYHLGAYTCEWNLVDGQITSEQTQEFHYTDVVSVSTLTSNTDFMVVTDDGEEHPIQSHQQFSLSVASNESIKITVAFPQVEAIFQQGKLLPTGADKAISTLRAMLREKKGGV